MKYSIQWLSHATTKIVTAKGTVIYIDPWFSNDLSPISLDEINDADIVCVSHDHFDHIGDAGALLKKCKNAVLVAQPELIETVQKGYGIEGDQIVNGGGGMNIGGTVEIKDVRIMMVEAVHSSNSGEPSGFIFEIEGERIYFAGDTSIFASMELLHKLYPAKVALLPIGGVFTMDPLQAAEAARILQPEVLIPIHYKTFPILTQSADTLTELVRNIAPGVSVKALNPGETLEF